jgi:hypothetical protein
VCVRLSSMGPFDGDGVAGSGMRDSRYLIACDSKPGTRISFLASRSV